MNRAARLALAAAAVLAAAGARRYDGGYIRTRRLIRDADAAFPGPVYRTRAVMQLGEIPGLPADGEPLSDEESLMWAVAEIALTLTPGDDGETP